LPANSPTTKVRNMPESYHAFLRRKTLPCPHQILRRVVRITMQVVDLIQELREEHARLARSLAEKEVLIKEVHHRVKNNLQIIASLLRLQAEAITEATAAAVLRDSQHRVEAIAIIHEQLYESPDLRQ